MADEQVTAALSDMSVSEMPPKLLNFPLPRELRDKIYGYLLDGDYTRLERQTHAEYCEDFQKDNAYHFYTNILGVNRIIRQEAEELLYKRNVFVVVSYQWPGIFHRTVSLFWMPMVSRKYAAKMKCHSLRIHVSPGAITLHKLTQGARKEAPLESFIILAKDLQAFCFLLQLTAASTEGPAISITTEPGEPASFEPENFANSKAKSMSLKCELRDTRYRAVDAALQYSLLAPLAVIIAPSQRVVFTGKICNPKEAESLKRTMSPTMVCQTALRWAYFERLTRAKELADAALDHDKIDFVLAFYMAVEALSLQMISCEDSQRELAQNYPDLWNAMCVFHFELMIIIAWGKLKIGDFEGFSAYFDGCRAFSEKTSQELGDLYRVPDGLLPYFDSLYVWWYLYVLGDEVEAMDPEFRTVGFVVSKLRTTAKQHGEHQAFELSLLERLPNQQAMLTKELLPYHQCSISQLPFPRTSFYQSVPGLEQRDNFKGWHDITLLRSLDVSQREILTSLQMASQIEVTDFDQL
jgi:hypothetical protein